MSILTRPSLQINLDNLLKNYQTLQKIAAPAVCAAVVKDDAYGLGAEKIVPLLYEKVNCRNFFVAHACEGAKIAPLAPQAVIYVLQGVGTDSLAEFIRYPQLIPVISAPEMLAFWQQNRPDERKAAIQVETGLNRLGFREADLKKLNEQAKAKLSLLVSHLACGDEKDHFMNAYQLEHFKRIKNKYFPKLPASLSASDGVFLGGEFKQDMVRLGAAMYGINTAPYRENQMQNVVTVTAPVLQITDLPAGQFVGYSATYRAGTKRKIAIVSIGYGDGLPRSLSNVGKVFFKDGKNLSEARIIGRVSMDNVICDVTNVKNLQVGDTAYFADEFYTLDDMGRDGGTISYEIMSNLGKNTRFNRRYILENF